MSRFLLVEDEIKMQTLIKDGLQSLGHEVDTTANPHEALENNKNKIYDLIILDVMLPEMNGFELAKLIRQKNSKSLILMLTALSSTQDKVMGFESGADDYLTKPFDFEELSARIKALLRRSQGPSSKLIFEDLEMDLIQRRVKRGSVLIELTLKEFSLLELFLRNPNKILDRMIISQSVWGTEFDPDSNVIDVYVNHLRKKLDIKTGTKLIKTMVGQGYVLS